MKDIWFKHQSKDCCWPDRWTLRPLKPLWRRRGFDGSCRSFELSNTLYEVKLSIIQDILTWHFIALRHSLSYFCWHFLTSLFVYKQNKAKCKTSKLLPETKYDAASLFAPLQSTTKIIMSIKTKHYYLCILCCTTKQVLWIINNVFFNFFLSFYSKLFLLSFTPFSYCFSSLSVYTGLVTRSHIDKHSFSHTFSFINQLILNQPKRQQSGEVFGTCVSQFWSLGLEYPMR